MRLIKEYIFWLTVLGGIAAAPPVISVAQRLFSIELISVFHEFVEFYRELVKPIVSALFSWTLWNPWPWLIDLYSINTLLWLSNTRAYLLTAPKPFAKWPSWFVFSLTLLLPLHVALLPLIAFGSFVVFFTRREMPKHEVKGVALLYVGIVVAVAAAIAFFAMNEAAIQLRAAT